MTTREQTIQAGRTLRRMREDQRLTQQDIERLTAERFGYEARVYAQQVSRVEKGALDKPPILDLLRYGQILGLTPDDIAEMYSLWPRAGSKPLDPRLQSAIDLAGELPLLEREKFLEWVRFAVLQARAEQQARALAPPTEMAPAPTARRGRKAPAERQ